MFRPVIRRIGILFLVAAALVIAMRWSQTYARRVSVEVEGVRISFTLPRDFARTPQKKEATGAFFSTPDARKGLWFTFMRDNSDLSAEQMRDEIAHMLIDRPPQHSRFEDVLVAGIDMQSGVHGAGLMYRISRDNPAKSATWHWHLIFRFEDKLFKLAGHLLAPNDVNDPAWSEAVTREFGPVFRSVRIEKVN